MLTLANHVTANLSNDAPIQKVYPMWTTFDTYYNLESWSRMSKYALSS